MWKLVLFLLLMSVAASGQTQPVGRGPKAQPQAAPPHPRATGPSGPPVYILDSIGPAGKFPFFYGKAVALPDADYTMPWDDFAMSVISYTGTLTGDRTVYAPAAGVGGALSTAFGFEYTIKNSTSGGHNLIIKPEGSPGATGVIIPPGEARMVIYDGTNYIAVGAAGGGAGGSNVASPFTVTNGSNTLTFTVPASGNPVLSSTSGGIDIDSLFATNLAGHGVSCLQTDNLGNVTAAGFACSPPGGGPSGGGGWGNIVPNPFTTIQAAITAGGPVIVLPSSTDNTAYSNPNGVRVQNYKQNDHGADSMFFRDVSEYGVIDGAQFSFCYIQAQQNTAFCGFPTGSSMTGFTKAPAPQGDIGKLIIIPQAARGTYGNIWGPITVSANSGVSPGTPNAYVGIIFTDPGDCYSHSDGTPNWDTQPYGHIQLDASGMPAVGTKVDFNNFAGKGCTHPPTQGTIVGSTGTVQFTGGQIAAGDLVTTVTDVLGPNTLQLADTADYTVNVNGFIGTDAVDTFEAACNDISKGEFVTSGTLTFSGIALISRGINCNRAGLRILGRGMEGFGSTIVYAGKTPNPDPAAFMQPTAGAQMYPTAYILNLAYGGAAKVERLHLIGNTRAMPMGIVISFGSNCNWDGTNYVTYPGQGWCGYAPGTGGFISQGHLIDQVVFNPFWGDGSVQDGNYRMQSCLFFAGWTGNADFADINHIYCYSADYGMDSVNDQATDLHIGKWQSDYSNVGISFAGGLTVDDYYTEGNRADFIMGSPFWPGAFPTTVHFLSYGGESSAMDYGGMGSGSYNCYGITMDAAGLGGGWEWRRPDGISTDFVHATPDPTHATCIGGIRWVGGSPANVLIPFYNQGGPNMEFLGGFSTTQFRFPAGSNHGCGYGECGWGPSNSYLRITGWNADFQGLSNDNDSHINVVPTPGWPNLMSLDVPTLLEMKSKSQITVGSLSLESVNWGGGAATGFGSGAWAVCNGIWAGSTGYVPCGTSTYTYQMTCIDSLGQESTPSPNAGYGGTTFTVTNAPDNLAVNPQNFVAVVPHSRPGCAKWGIYGDNGQGGVIGYLGSLSSEPYWTVAYYQDRGQPKDPNRTVPTINRMGSLLVNGDVQLKQFPNAASLATDQNGYIIPGVGGPGSAGIASINQQSGPAVTIQGAGTVSVQEAANVITINGAAGGGGVTSLNNLTGAVNLVQGANVTLTPSGNNITIAAAGGAGPGSTSWSALTNPTGSNQLTFGNYHTYMDWTLTGQNTNTDTVGLGLLDVGTANPPLISGILVVSSAAPRSNLFPMEVSVSNASGNLNGGWRTNGIDASIETLASGLPTHVKLPIQLMNLDNSAPVTGAAALGTDANGFIIPVSGGVGPGGAPAGTGPGGTIAVNNLAGATGTGSLTNADSQQEWTWSLVNAPTGFHIDDENTPSTNGNGTLFVINTAPSSQALPMWVSGRGYNNGFKVDQDGNLVLMGTAKIRLPGLSNVPLAADPSGNIVAGSGGPGPGGPVSWSSLTNPTGNVTLDMTAVANGTAYFKNSLPSVTAPGGSDAFEFDDQTSTNPTAPADLIYVWGNAPNVNPLEVQGYTDLSPCPPCGGFFVNGSTGDIQMEGGAGVRGPLILLTHGTVANPYGTPVASAAFLGTGPDGSIIPSAGVPGTSVSISALISATGPNILNNNGPYEQQWYWMFDNNASPGVGLSLSDKSLSGSSAGQLLELYTDNTTTAPLGIYTPPTPQHAFGGWWVEANHGDFESVDSNLATGGEVVSGSLMEAPQFTINPHSGLLPFSGQLTRDADGHYHHPAALKLPLTGRNLQHSSAMRVLSLNGNNYLDIDVPDNGNPTITSSTGTVDVQGAGAPGGGVSDTPLYHTPITLRFGTASNVLQFISAVPGCNTGTMFCVMTTPTSDGTYRFTFEVSQTIPAIAGAGACNQGGLAVALAYRNVDTNLDENLNYVPVRAANNTVFTRDMAMNATANGADRHWISAPFEFRARGGTAIQLRLIQTNTNNCDTPPQFIIRPALYGPLGY